MPIWALKAEDQPAVGECAFRTESKNKLREHQPDRDDSDGPGKDNPNWQSEVMWIGRIMDMIFMREMIAALSFIGGFITS